MVSMMGRFTVIIGSLLLWSTFINGLNLKDPEEIHVVLISAIGCNDAKTCELSYSTEADVLHTYHFLVDHGVPAKNIITFLNYDIIVDKRFNPYPGKIYHDPLFSRDYAQGVVADYKSAETTPENILAVLTGDKNRVKGGSGRVLNSTKNDRVFILHESHGTSAALIIGLTGILTAKDMKDALDTMHKKNMYKELTFFLMACHSGSMFHNLLTPNINIYAVTAANPFQDALAGDEWSGEVNGTHFSIVLNSEFGRTWLQDAEQKNLKSETLENQFKTVKEGVKLSEVCRYGDMGLANKHLADFMGSQNTTVKSKKLKLLAVNGVAQHKIPISPMARYLRLKKQHEKNRKVLIQSNSPANDEFSKLERERQNIRNKAKSMYIKLPATGDIYKAPETITKLDCNHHVLKAIFKHCQSILKSPFIDDFIIPMVNLCESNTSADDIINKLHVVCSN